MRARDRLLAAIAAGPFLPRACMDMSSDGRVAVDTVGSLLAVIANAIQDALRVLMFADKRVWGPPEFEQLRLLEEVLDEAKRDFQELPALVNGRFYYENDRKGMFALLTCLSRELVCAYRSCYVITVLDLWRG